MTHYSGRYQLENALLWLFDPEADRNDFPEIDTSEIVAFSYESLLVVVAQHEVDGPMRLDVYVDEAPVLKQTPVNLGEGQIELFSGRLAVAESPSLEPEDEFQLTAGLYDMAVYGDANAFPEHVVLHLNRHAV